MANYAWIDLCDPEKNHLKLSVVDDFIREYEELPENPDKYSEPYDAVVEYFMTWLFRQGGFTIQESREAVLDHVQEHAPKFVPLFTMLLNTFDFKAWR